MARFHRISPAFVAVIAAVSLSACGILPAPAPVSPQPPQAVQSFPGLAAARTPDQLDPTTDAERAAAIAATPVAGNELGRVRVSLGAPAEQGFWLKSPLVDAVRQGRVAVTGGASVAVELRPGAGAAQLSLAAFRALGLPLTGLPEVTVTAD